MTHRPRKVLSPSCCCFPARDHLIPMVGWSGSIQLLGLSCGPAFQAPSACCPRASALLNVSCAVKPRVFPLCSWMEGLSSPSPCCSAACPLCSLITRRWELKGAESEASPPL